MVIEKVMSYKDLIVWRKAMDFVVEIYKVSENFSKREQYGLVSQIRRSAVSIPSNIAEGRSRGSKAEFRRFVLIAFSSVAEIETQLELSKRLNYLTIDCYKRLIFDLSEIQKILRTIEKTLKVYKA